MTQDPGTTQAAGRRWRDDLPAAVVVLVGCVLLGAPVGLLWSALAPRLRVTFDEQGPVAPDLESSDAFIGADGTFLLIVLVVGALCGTAAWLLARRSGPWTVAALAVGGLLAGVVAARVGVLPGAEEAISALQQKGADRPPVDLYLGALGEDGRPHLRSSFAVVGWPVGALAAFLVGAVRRPEELD